MWCWTDGCLLSQLQQRSNVVPAWIVVIAHWTTVFLSTASRLSRRLCRRLCLLYCPGIPACFRPGPVNCEDLKCEVHYCAAGNGARHSEPSSLPSSDCLMKSARFALLWSPQPVWCRCRIYLWRRLHGVWFMSPYTSKTRVWKVGRHVAPACQSWWTSRVSGRASIDVAMQQNLEHFTTRGCFSKKKFCRKFPGLVWFQAIVLRNDYRLPEIHFQTDPPRMSSFHFNH